MNKREIDMLQVHYSNGKDKIQLVSSSSIDPHIPYLNGMEATFDTCADVILNDWSSIGVKYIWISKNRCEVYPLFGVPLQKPPYTLLTFHPDEIRVRSALVWMLQNFWYPGGAHIQRYTRWFYAQTLSTNR